MCYSFGLVSAFCELLILHFPVYLHSKYMHIYSVYISRTWRQTFFNPLNVINKLMSCQMYLGHVRYFFLIKIVFAFVQMGKKGTADVSKCVD